MGLLKRKTVEEETVVSPTRLQGLANDDVYLFLETTLMDSQQKLSEYRRAMPEDKVALLKWLESSVSSAAIGVQELLSRNLQQQG